MLESADIVTEDLSTHHFPWLFDRTLSSLKEVPFTSVFSFDILYQQLISNDFDTRSDFDLLSPIDLNKFDNNL